MSRPVWVIEEQANPTTDYYLLPAFFSLGWEIERLRHADPLPRELPHGLVLVFVRYLPGHWISLVEAFRARIGRMIFFMDDDVLDVSASKGTPLRYRVKLATRSAGRKSWLRRHGAELWVSTPYLHEKYAAWNPSMVHPSPITRQPVRTFFYHGSAAHGPEIRWLRPVVDEVLKQDEHCHFEIIGGPEVSRLYRGMPRVTVVHPMKWPAYQKFIALSGRAVGLAPVLDTAFNRARSYSKFFDITRAGAVGIYTRGSCFGSVIDHEVEGLLHENDQEEWASAIVRLLQDTGMRSRMSRSADRKTAELRISALENYACLA